MAISTSQRKASVASMMRFSMIRLLAFHAGAEEVRLEGEAAVDDDLFARRQTLEHRRPAAAGRTHPHRTHREPIRRGADEDYFLSVDLLDRVGRVIGSSS